MISTGAELGATICKYSYIIRAQSIDYRSNHFKHHIKRALGPGASL